MSKLRVKLYRGWHLPSDYSPAPISSWVDRLVYPYTVVFLVLCSFALAAKDMVFGSPIVCAARADFQKSWLSYADAFCFTNERFTLLDNTDVPGPGSIHVPGSTIMHRDNIYQWVAYVVLLQAILLYIPYGLWSWAQSKSDMKMAETIECIKELPSLEMEARREKAKEEEKKDGGEKGKSENAKAEIGKEKGRKADKEKKEKPSHFDALVTHIEDHLHRRRTSPLVGRELSAAYVGHKVLALLMLWLISIYFFAVFGEGHVFWALDEVRELLLNHVWWPINAFPTKIFCSFTMTLLGGPQKVTTECVVKANLINDKLFVGIALWYGVLMVTLALDTIRFAVRLFHPDSRFNIANAIIKPRAIDLNETTTKGLPLRPLLYRFMESLGSDGVLLLMLAKHNAGCIYTRHVGRALCAHFSKALASRHAVRHVSHQLSVEAQLGTGGVRLRAASMSASLPSALESSTASSPTFAPAEPSPS